MAFLYTYSETSRVLDFVDFLQLSNTHTAGFEIAKALFRRPERHHILIGCRGDIGRASDAISELKQLSPDSASTAEPLSIDVTSDKSIAAAVDEVRAKIGHLDVLVNNAGE